ncbi:hypothetical protein EDC01DRAFT_759116, partial [Geopyxis carbonaria]
DVVWSKISPNPKIQSRSIYPFQFLSFYHHLHSHFRQLIHLIIRIMSTPTTPAGPALDAPVPASNTNDTNDTNDTTENTETATDTDATTNSSRYTPEHEEALQFAITRYHKHLLLDWHHATNGTERPPSNYTTAPSLLSMSPTVVERFLNNYYNFCRTRYRRRNEFFWHHEGRYAQCVSIFAHALHAGESDGVWGPYMVEMILRREELVDLGTVDTGVVGEEEGMARVRQGLQGSAWIQEWFN